MLHHSILAAFLFLALGQNTVMAQGGATKTFLQAQIATYPGAAEQGITGNVDMRFPNPTGGFFFSVDVTGLEADCVFCGVHVHEGTSCDTADAPGGNYWDIAEVGTFDPWFFAVYSSDASGVTNSTFSLISGYNQAENVGHVVVITGADGSRIGCGVLNEVADQGEITECGGVTCAAPSLCHTTRFGKSLCVLPEPEWWGRVNENFVGTNLKRCIQRIDVHPGAVGCATRPKTCYFGLQYCPNGVGASPVTRCYCDGNVWSCEDPICPLTIDQAFP